MVKSTMTLPCFISVTIFSVTIGSIFILGIVPISTSALRRLLVSSFGSIIEVDIRLPMEFWIFLSLDRELSKTLTVAPSPIAALTAYSPTISAPKTTTSTGRTPVIPPSISPFETASISDAQSTDIPPAISPISFTSICSLFSSSMNS